MTTDRLRTLSTYYDASIPPDLLGGGGSPFDPLALTGLTGWWDGSDLASSTYSGGGLSRWGNKSGHGPDLANPDYNTQPYYPGFQPMNGHKVLYIEQISFVSAALALPQPFTVLFVMENMGGAGVIIGGVATNAGGNFTLAAPTVVDTGASAAGVTQVTAVFDGAASGIYVNGASHGPVNPGAGALSTVSAGAAAGGMTGTLCEVFLCAGRLVDAERIAAQGWLREKWATP
jgi:hypothetical protein